MPDYTDMTDTELRIEVAKRKGWTEVQWHSQGAVDLGREGTFSSWLRGRSPDMDAHAYSEVPDWLTDLNVAWGLVEECTSEGSGEFMLVYVVGPDQWEASFDSPKGLSQVIRFTPHRAIVCAWLEWMDQKGESDE